MKKFITIGLVLFFGFLYSQTDGPKIDKQNALFTIRGHAGVPAGLSSNMFRFAFKGVYEFDLTANYRLFDNFHMGIGFRQTAFKNNPDYFTYYKDPKTTFTIPYDTRFMVNSFIINLGYDKFYSDKFYINYHLQSGIAISEFKKVIEDTSFKNKPIQATKFSTPFIKAQTSFNFIVDPKLCFNIYLGYQSVLFNFDPRSPRMNQYDELREKSNKHGIAWLSFGFGFNVLIDKKTK
jgi:hypothetical protein